MLRRGGGVSVGDGDRRPLCLHLCCDGASRGNPGPASAAAVLRDEEGTVLTEVSQRLGSTTNNVAEYFGLIIGLEEALKLRADEVVVESDSQLLVRQCSGEYRVRNARLRRLRDWVSRLEQGFTRVTYRHVPRERNREADALARRAFKKSSPAEE